MIRTKLSVSLIIRSAKSKLTDFLPSVPILLKLEPHPKTRFPVDVIGSREESIDWYVEFGTDSLDDRFEVFEMIRIQSRTAENDNVETVCSKSQSAHPGNRNIVNEEFTLLRTVPSA